MNHDELAEHIPELQDKNDFSFDELDDDAKDRAVESLASHTQDSSWHEDFGPDDIDAVLPKDVDGNAIVKFVPGQKGHAVQAFDLDRGDIDLNGDFESVDGIGLMRLLGIPQMFHGVPGVGIVPSSMLVEALSGQNIDDPVEFDHDALVDVLNGMIQRDHETDDDFGFERPAPAGSADTDALVETAARDIERQLEETVGHDAGQELVRGFEQDVLAALRRRHEHETSRESVVDMIEANGYRFDREGNLA